MGIIKWLLSGGGCAGQTSPKSLLSPPPVVAAPPRLRAHLGGVMARRKVSKLAQIIFNNQQSTKAGGRAGRQWGGGADGGR